MTESAQLRVERAPKGYPDRLRAYNIILDGRKVGPVKSGEAIDIAMEPGTHAAMLKIDWCSSPAVAFSATPGEIVTFACRPSPIWSSLWRAWFAKGRYVMIERAGQTL
jgi:hypothetical protein